MYRQIYRYRRELYAERDAFGFPEIHRTFEAWCDYTERADMHKEPKDAAKWLLKFERELDDAALRVEQVDAAQSLDQWEEQGFDDPGNRKDLAHKLKAMKQTRETNQVYPSSIKLGFGPQSTSKTYFFLK